MMAAGASISGPTACAKVAHPCTTAVAPAPLTLPRLQTHTDPEIVGRSARILSPGASAAAGCLDLDRFPDSGRGARSTHNRLARPARKARFQGPVLAAVHCHSQSLRTRRDRLRLERASTPTLQLRTLLRPRR